MPCLDTAARQSVPGRPSAGVMGAEP